MQELSKAEKSARKRERQRKRLMIFGTFTLIIGLVCGVLVGGIGKKSLEKEVAALSEQLKEKDTVADTELPSDVAEDEPTDIEEPAEVELPWNMVLVNPWNEMEEGYKPELEEVEPGMMVDSRIATDLRNMLNDAKAAGLSPFICSAYRSLDRQEDLFNNKIEKMRNRGLGYYDAYVEAAKVVAVPGTSEHALGLAVDIVSSGYTNLDEGQENTDEFEWFKDNCYKYGFILRYPNGTTDITGIIYEPWHYRYVGVEAATEITNLGVTLEEYLENHYDK